MRHSDISRSLLLDPKGMKKKTNLGGYYDLAKLNQPTFSGRIIAIYIVLQRVNHLVDNPVVHQYQFELMVPWLKINKVFSNTYLWRH